MIDDPDVRVLLGDALELLATLPAESVQCIVTSPPFWGLRDYGTGSWSGGDPDCDHQGPPKASTKSGLKNDGRPAEQVGQNEYERGATMPYRHECGKCGALRVDQQIGLEETPEEWCARLVAVFREARRVLRSDGVLWLEVGDSYANDAKWGGASGEKNGYGAATGAEGYRQRRHTGLKAKDLVGAPWLLAFALRADGWHLRSDVIWARPNPMPESVTDRPTKAHSYVFLLTKSARYFYDADAIREPLARTWDPAKPNGRSMEAGSTRAIEAGKPGAHVQTTTVQPNPLGANARSVWSIATQPTPFAHFATFPEELVRRCIAAGTSDHGCCPECGAPWRRVSERTVDHPGNRSGNGHRQRDEHVASRAQRREVTRETIGWEPTGCTCEEELEPVPCTVLDPFMGSGTTALVARRMGRYAVGIELSPEYLEIARERLAQQSLFA